MDRDNRWERTERAVGAIVSGEGDACGGSGRGGRGELRARRDRRVRRAGRARRASARLGPQDAAIFFNFRPDRARQLSQRLLEAGIDLTTMTRYRDDFHVPGRLRASSRVKTRSPRFCAASGLRQLHVAETEKYAHVTYFFNGGEESEWPGETRDPRPSPRDVPSYDLKPEMSRRRGRRRASCDEIGDGYAFAVVNFANPDMVGHTGVDPRRRRRRSRRPTRALGRVVARVTRRGGVCLVTADHGNAEQMLEPDGVSPHTAHTTNPVPLVLTERALSSYGRRRGSSDLAPDHPGHARRARFLVTHDRCSARNASVTARAQ